MQNHWLYKKNRQKLSADEKRELFDQIQKSADKKHRQRRVRLYLSVSAAACIILAIVFLNPFIPVHTSSEMDMLSHTAENTVNEKDIQLILANNKTITFQNDADIKYDEKGEITVDSGNEQIKDKKTDEKDFFIYFSVCIYCFGGESSKWSIGKRTPDDDFELLEIQLLCSKR